MDIANGAVVDFDAQLEEAAYAITDYSTGDSIENVARAVARLVRQVAVYRGRAAYWQGKAESQAEMIAYLKARVDQLESGAPSPGP